MNLRGEEECLRDSKCRSFFHKVWIRTVQRERKGSQMDMGSKIGKWVGTEQKEEYFVLQNECEKISEDED